MREPKLSVLFVYDCLYPDSLGGVEHRNYRLAEQLSRRGHRVVRAGWGVAPDGYGDDLCVMPLAVPIHKPDGKRSILATIKFALATLSLPLQGLDVVETANIPFLHLFPLALRCAYLRVPLVITWHEFWGDYWQEYTGRIRSFPYRTIEWIAAQLGTEVAAVSGFTASKLGAARRRSGKIRVIPCGVDVGHIKAVTASEPRESHAIIFVGRLIPEKRVEILISALSYLDREIRLRIVGDGTDRKRLEYLSRDLDLESRVQFLGRLDSAEDVWKEIARARVAVQPSAREGFGMFPLEALACGTPVVYCEGANNALSELVIDKVHGYRAPAEPQAIAEKIRALIGDRELWTEFSKRAAAKAVAYQWDEIGNELEGFLQSVIRSSQLDARRRH